MNDEPKLYMNIFTKRDLSFDEFLDAFREAGILTQELDK